MKLAKPRIDVGLFTDTLAPTLAFWQNEVHAEPDHVLKVRRGIDQHRYDLNGSVLKINHLAEPLTTHQASGYYELLLPARETIPQALVDPNGARMRFVATGEEGVTQLGMHLLVRDLVAHRRFYGEALGLPEESVGRFRAGESVILLEQSARALASSPDRARGWSYITFQVFKVDDEHARAVARGAVSSLAPVTLGTTARIAVIKDPDGNGIELSQRASIVGSLD